MMWCFQSIDDCPGDGTPSTTDAPPVSKEERRGGDGAEDVCPVVPVPGKVGSDAASTDSSPSVSADREVSPALDAGKGKPVAEAAPKVKESSRSRKKEDKSIGEFNHSSFDDFHI